MKKTICLLFTFLSCIISLLPAQEIVARWTFDSIDKTTVLEQVGNKPDQIIGFFDQVPGVSNQAIHFDGFTSFLDRKNLGMNLPDHFTISAWIRLEAYPWFRCPVFDLRSEEKEGILLGIDQNGHLTSGLGIPSNWKELEGRQLPLRQWVQISLVVNRGGTVRLYLNGEEEDYLDQCPQIRETKNYHFTVGRNAVLEKWWDYQYTVEDRFSFLDGQLDELTVYGEALNSSQLEQMYSNSLPLPVLETKPRILPAGPEGPSEFGAHYTRLNYTPQWDRLWRVGDYPDVLVRFADNNCRLVFWRGTSFVPCWVTENGIWYTNEWCETWGSDVTSCAEPLMDRDCRFSHVRIIENTPARTVVHWRYGLVDTEYKFVAQDVDGRGEWADEYYIIYPDGVGIRRIDLHYSKPLRNHDWEEAIVLLSPGQHPDEVMADPEITLVNMAGETHDYSWRNNLPIEMKQPEKANIHVVNFKSEYKPFFIVSPDPFESKEGKYQSPFFRSYSAALGPNWHPDSVPSVYGWWNHWPVTPVPGDGRWVVNNDRASHFNLTTYTQWKDYYMDERVKTRIMLHGMTNQNAKELVPLAQSWLEAPELRINDDPVPYETAERAYMIGDSGNLGFQGQLLASKKHPAVNPAFILENCRLEHPSVWVDGKKLKEAVDYQVGVVKELEQWKSIIWLKAAFSQPTALKIQ